MVGYQNYGAQKASRISQEARSNKFAHDIIKTVKAITAPVVVVTLGLICE